MTKEEVISKVRKLFELAKSSNENEAALAASQSTGTAIPAQYGVGGCV